MCPAPIVWCGFLRGIAQSFHFWLRFRPHLPQNFVILKPIYHCFLPNQEEITMCLKLLWFGKFLRLCHQVNCANGPQIVLSAVSDSGHPCLSAGLPVLNSTLSLKQQAWLSLIFLKYSCHFSSVQAAKSSVVTQIMCFKPQMGAAVMQHLLHRHCATWATPKEALSPHDLHHPRRGCFSLQPWSLTHHYLLWIEWKC